jgi:muramoyltetrapeptide carboxypeptidase
MNRTAVRPPLLASGARVALVSPSGPVRDEGDVERAMNNARAMGWDPVPGTHVRARAGYLAGTDHERLADLNLAIRDSRVDGIWCVRGGYGAIRLLADLDYDALRAHPKALIGYSDVTALHLAIRARCDLVTFHGPTARSPLANLSRESLAAAVVRGVNSCGALAEPGTRVLRGGRASGRLEGGNLALVASLVGTPFAARLDDAILVLEDVNEPVYRIDRMLRQLKLAGSFARVRALVFGAFTERGDSDPTGDRPLDDVLGEAAQLVSGPCVAGVPVGHLDAQWTVPLGAMATLDADAQTLNVHDHATVWPMGGK